MQEAYFHLVRELESLQSLATRLYGSSETPIAKDFIRINTVVAADGYVWPGAALFLPEPMCFGSDMEAHVTEVVRAANGEGAQMMSMPERQFLSANHHLVNNTAKNASLINNVLNLANTGASGLLASASLQTRIMSSSLKKLETKYVQEFRQHGKLTPHFFVERQQAYRTLDTALGRISRTLTMGTPYSTSAKSVLKVNTKSQVLHWKRNGTESGVKGFAKHFETMKQHGKYFKAGGALTVGIDGIFTYDKIQQACSVGSERECRRTAVVEGASFGGRAGGGAGGGALAYVGCNALFGAPSFGTSLMWCGVVAGLAGGALGGYVGEGVSRPLSEFLFEATYSTR
ncbi:MAG: hypothetical protein CL583_06345 [Alteromonadaceae bacterium]|nr:hypothetical protein [Alteromonadaceae bacterium]